MSEAADVSQPTHYQVLQLERGGRSVGHGELKDAYRQALLLHHPDRKYRSSSTISKSVGQSSNRSYSVDQITRAYKTLSNGVAKAKYDRFLDWNSARLKASSKTSCSVGMETYDLDEFYYDHTANIWYRECTCGHARAYTLTESDLEEESGYSEIHVACKGCSLSIRVLYGTAAPCSGP